MSDVDDFIGRIPQKHPENHDFTPGFSAKMQFYLPNCTQITRSAAIFHY